MTRYAEIFRLKTMLENASIPFEFYDRSYRREDGELSMVHDRFGAVVPVLELYQIAYPKVDRSARVYSVIEGTTSIGNEYDSLEILEEDDSICGGLTAECVFDLIQKYHKRYVLRQG